jgi:hypothetical protein
LPVFEPFEREALVAFWGFFNNGVGGKQCRRGAGGGEGGKKLFAVHLKKAG